MTTHVNWDQDIFVPNLYAYTTLKFFFMLWLSLTKQYKKVIIKYDYAFKNNFVSKIPSSKYDSKPQVIEQSLFFLPAAKPTGLIVV